MTLQEMGEFVRGEASKVIAGQDKIIEQMLVCMLAAATCCWRACRE